MRLQFLFHLIIILLVAGSQSCNKTLTSEEIYNIHQDLYTVDSHTDTPLRMMRQGTDLGIKNDPRKNGGKVDFVRMMEGGLDGVFFAVFVGQSARTAEGNARAKVMAMELFDSIFAVVERYPDRVELAVESGDLERIASEGRSAVYIGIENGYTIGRDLSLIEQYYELGARYITLCHTANNDICDSSTDNNGPEHNGLSVFGRKVVSEMNRLGIMIDVSHISDNAFYDVLELSGAPVIASHSNARAICEHPRNLDDDMLLALAENKGVIQFCILNDYVAELERNSMRDSARQALQVRYNSEDLDDSTRAVISNEWNSLDEIFPPNLATVSQFVDHVDHVVELIGIDHVGFGSDFDGGAGIEGCYDVSELSNITAEMLSRGYSISDLEKFWSSNLLRVMKEVEKTAATAQQGI